jgi:acetylornithine/succinyldiaminopimelate/putrescine aminotransferase
MGNSGDIEDRLLGMAPFSRARRPDPTTSGRFLGASVRISSLIPADWSIMITAMDRSATHLGEKLVESSEEALRKMQEEIVLRVRSAPQHPNLMRQLEELDRQLNAVDPPKPIAITTTTTCGADA